MTPEPPAVLLVREPAKLLLTLDEAAERLSMSPDSFAKYVRPTLRVVIRGNLRLIPVRELERWVEENAERPA